MKKNLTLAAMIFAVISINAHANTINQNYSSKINLPLNNDNISKKCFVKMNDGTIREFKTLTLVTGLFKSPHLLADGKIKIKPSEILEYKTNDQYAVSQRLFEDGRHSNVSTETLPGFAVLVMNGPLNVYSKKYFNGTVSIDEFFIQSGNEGKIYAFSIKRMTELLASQPEALNAFLNHDTDSNLSSRLQHVNSLMIETTLTAKN